MTRPLTLASVFLSMLLLAGCATNRTDDPPIMPIDTIEQLDVWVATWMPVYLAMVDEGILSDRDLEALDRVVTAVQLVRLAVEAGGSGQQELAAARTAIAVWTAIVAIREFK